MHSGAGCRFEPLAAAWRDIDGCRDVVPVAHLLVLFQPKTHAPLFLSIDNVVDVGFSVKVLQAAGPGNVTVSGPLGGPIDYQIFCLVRRRLIVEILLRWVTIEFAFQLTLLPCRDRRF